MLFKHRSIVKEADLATTSDVKPIIIFIYNFLLLCILVA